MPVVIPDNSGLIPCKVTNIYLCCCVQAVSGSHSALYSSTLSSMSMQLTTSLHPVPGYGAVFALPCVFLTWWLTERSNSFNFSFIVYISHSLCLESGEFKSETVVIVTKITAKKGFFWLCSEKGCYKMLCVNTVLLTVHNIFLCLSFPPFVPPETLDDLCYFFYLCMLSF